MKYWAYNAQWVLFMISKTSSNIYKWGDGPEDDNMEGEENEFRFTAKTILASYPNLSKRNSL